MNITRRGLFIAVVAVSGAAAAALALRDTGTPARSASPPKTVEVTRETLVDYDEVSGELGYGDAQPLRYVPPTAADSTSETDGPPADDGQGLVTWLPAVGSTVERGGALFRVDNRPVVLLYGALPLYRTLAVGVRGPDVRQFEENLRALGFTGFTVDTEYSASTASAVRRWQKALGLAETATVAPGQLLYTSAAVRVAAHTLRVGDRADGDVLRYTGTARTVALDLPLAKQRYATAGATVTVTLPNGRTLAGTVASVGAEGGASGERAGQASSGAGGEPTIHVIVAIGDQATLGAAALGQVKVRFVVEERKDVLTVPVVALVVLLEGGYGVQVVDGATTRYVPVETGMFARGRVEILAGDLVPGMRVVVPK